MPIRKLLSAQLSKTLVNRCFLSFFTNILKIIVILFCSIEISRIFVKEITTKKIEIMKTQVKQNLTSDLLNAGFTKKDFTLKKVAGYLTLVVNELNKNSFTAYILAKKYFVNLQYNGKIYGIGAIEKETGYVFNK